MKIYKVIEEDLDAFATIFNLPIKRKFGLEYQDFVLIQKQVNSALINKCNGLEITFKINVILVGSQIIGSDDAIDLTKPATMLQILLDEYKMNVKESDLPKLISLYKFSTLAWLLEFIRDKYFQGVKIIKLEKTRPIYKLYQALLASPSTYTIPLCFSLMDEYSPGYVFSSLNTFLEKVILYLKDGITLGTTEFYNKLIHDFGEKYKKVLTLFLKNLADWSMTRDLTICRAFVVLDRVRAFESEGVRFE